MPATPRTDQLLAANPSTIVWAQKEKAPANLRLDLSMSLDFDSQAPDLGRKLELPDLI
jgi:hypothetical protein